MNPLLSTQIIGLKCISCSGVMTLYVVVVLLSVPVSPAVAVLAVRYLVPLTAVPAAVVVVVFVLTTT